jgi:hypothetical protein
LSTAFNTSADSPSSANLRFSIPHRMRTHRKMRA